MMETTTSAEKTSSSHLEVVRLCFTDENELRYIYVKIGH